MGADGSFSEELLRERYSSDLANGLGNLWHRFASMVEKYYNGQVPEGEPDWTTPVLAKALALEPSVSKLMREYNPKDSLVQIFEVITMANQFVEERKPWSLSRLASDPTAQPADVKLAQINLAETMIILAEVLLRTGFLLLPFLPKTAPKILTRLKSSPTISGLSLTKRVVAPLSLIEKGDPLFPRLEDEPLKA